MSHELRTPLNAIIGFSEVLHGNGPKDLVEKSRVEYAGHIHSAGRHLLNLVNDALDLPAVEAGGVALSEAVLDLDRRSAEHRVGTECVSTCSSRWSPSH